MANMQKTKTPMPTLAADERIKNFDEVALGYTEEMLQNEVERCLNCPTKPCVSGCPVGNKIPEFIALAKEKRYEEAYQKIREGSTLPAVCGRVCPQELQCEKHCVRGRASGCEPVGIGRIERWLGDWHNKNRIDHRIAPLKPNGKTVAIIGGGPSGLACAHDLSELGYSVTIFEGQSTLGGVLRYGIPEFMLPNKVVDEEIANALNENIIVKTNAKVSSVIELKQNFDAVYIACGTGKSKSMGIEGEDAENVFLAAKYLYEVNMFGKAPKSKHTVVVGGGNVAMDAARCARRFGAEVTLVYRRTREQMPSRHEEIIDTEEEGVKYETLSNPTKIIVEDGKIVGVECVKMQLTEEVDERGQKSKPIVGSNYIIACDALVMALGYGADGVIQEAETDQRGMIKTNENFMTSVEGVFAGGDITTGALTVIKAMGAGRKAAVEIHKYLSK